MKPVAVIVGILLLLLIVGMCCTPKSYSDLDSNSSSDDSSNKSVAKGLGKTLDTGRMGYKYEDKMCVAVKDAPNEHANPPIYDSLMNCYIHHMPLGFKWIDGKCKVVAVEPNGVDVFTTEEECKNRHKKLGPDGKDNHPYGPHGKDNHPYGPHGKDNHPYGPDGKHHEHPYGPNGKHHEHPYGPNGKHHEHPYGPDGLEDGYKLFYDGKEEECIKVNKPIDNVNVLTKEVCEYKLKNGYGPHGKGFNPDGPHGKGFNPDGPHGKGYRPDLKPHPGHDECACEKNQYIMINSN